MVFSIFLFGLVLYIININAILYYKTILRPHGITRVLFFVILFVLSINAIYYVIGLIAVMYFYISALPAFMANF